MARSRIADVDKLLRRAEQDAGILAVLLFGSVARGEQTAHSDVDICLVLTPECAGDKSTFPSRKRLEYLAEFNLDIQIFQALPLYMRHRVFREGQVLLVRDEDTLYHIAFQTAQAFEDFKPIYHRYLEQVAHAGP